MPALTASTSLFVGAAGTLVYNRIMTTKQEQEKDTATVVDVDTIDIKALEASIQTMVPDKKQQEQDDLELKKFQAEIDLALQAANVAIENASPKKEKNKAPAALLESLAAKNNGETTNKESKVASSVSSKPQEPAVENDKGAEAPVITNVKSSQMADDTTAEKAKEEPTVPEKKEPVPSFIAPTKSSSKQVVDVKPEEAVREPLIVEPKQKTVVKAAETAKEESTAQETKEPVPSFISPTKSSSKQVMDVKPKEVAPEPVVAPKAAKAAKEEPTAKETKEPVPSFIAPPESPSKPVADVKPTDPVVEKELTTSETQPVAAKLGDATMTEDKAKEASNGQAVQATPVKPVVKNVSPPATSTPTKEVVPPRKVPQEAATSFRIQPRTPRKESTAKKTATVKQPSVAVASSPKATQVTQANKQTSLPVKEAVMSTASTPAAATAVKTAPATMKQAVPTSPHETPSPTRPQSIRDIMPNASSMPTMTRSSNGVATESRPPPERHPVTTNIKTPPSYNNDGDASLKTSLSMLSNQVAPGKEEDFETAMDSLHKHIQNQARDMTRNKIYEKNGVLNDSDMPGFIAPEQVETKVATAETVRSMSSDSVQRQVATSSVSTAADPSSVEQVAKSLKKKSNPSLAKKVRKSTVLVVLATGAVVVGKRLAVVVIGRGLL